MTSQPSRGSDRGGTSDGRAHAELSLREHRFLDEFNNLRHEWVRLFAELLGTYLLVIVAEGGGMVDSLTHGGVGRLAQVTAPGVMVMAIILSLGAVSGAHLNPVVTVAFAFRTDFQWRRVPGYVLAQCVGAALAAFTLATLFGRHGDAGTTIPGPGFSTVQALLVEILITFGLLTVVLGAASGAQNIGPLSALAAGGYVILAGLWAGPVSGASMNPARSLGPELINGTLNHGGVYVLGPTIGALLAVAVAYLLRGPGGDLTAKHAAQGTIE